MDAAAKLPHVGKEDPLKVFADTVAVNLNGAYYMSQCVQPYMPVGRSSIIHISSTRAYQSEPNTEGYSASKAGLCGLTHSQVKKINSHLVQPCSLQKSMTSNIRIILTNF
jgi:NAD(P)-dependent dehydrogenase (short-subunit alcohol dehydrogenase family)